VTLKDKIFESQNILNLLDHKKTKEPTLTIVLSNTIWINFYHLIIHKFIPDNEAQLSMRGRRGLCRMAVGFTITYMQSMTITTNVLSSNLAHVEVYLASKEKLIKLLGEKNKSLYYENQQLKKDKIKIEKEKDEALS
jgi:hypothetical protein